MLDDLAAPKWTKHKPAPAPEPEPEPPAPAKPVKPARLRVRAATSAKPPAEPAPAPVTSPEPAPPSLDELMRLLDAPITVDLPPVPPVAAAVTPKPAVRRVKAKPKPAPVPTPEPVVQPEPDHPEPPAKPAKAKPVEPEPESFSAWLGVDPDEVALHEPEPEPELIEQPEEPAEPRRLALSDYIDDIDDVAPLPVATIPPEADFDGFWGPDESADELAYEPAAEPSAEPSDEAVAPVAPPAVRPGRRSRRGALVRFGRLLARTLFPGPMDTGYQPQWKVAAITGAAVFVLLVIRLLVPTVVGMSDQGDGQRLLCQLGVANVAPSNYVLMWQHIYTQWTPHQWYGETCGTLATGNAYISSQLLLLWPAKFLTPMFGWGFGLDTRAVGLVCALVFSVLLTCFVAFLPGRIGFRVMMGAFVAGVMADGIFVDFFISPYSEAACFLGVFAMFVAMLYMWRKGYPTLLGIGFFTLASLFTIMAKTQMVAVLPVAIVALLWRCTHRGPSGNQWLRINWPWGETPKSPNRLQRAIPALIAIGVLTGGTVGYYLVQPSDLGELNRYNAIFVEMLPNSDNPKGDLQWFGLDPAMSSASGTTVASVNSAIFMPGYKDFNTKVTEAKIAMFYVVHPNRLVSMLDRGLDAMAHPVLSYLGSYTIESGQPASAKETRWPVVQGISVVFAAVPALFIFVELLTPVLGIAVASRRRLGRQSRAFGMASALFSLSLILQFWAVMLSEGASEIYKHMIVVTFMNALCLVWIVGLGLVLWAPANLDEGSELEGEAAS